jgi:inner membrane protein
MDPVTHVAAGLLLSQIMPGPSRVWSVLAGLGFAFLPDIDYFLVYSDRLAFIRHHRGFTHSLMALALFALLGAGIGRALGGPPWFRPILFLGLAVLASHLLLDLATSYGTQILSPFSRRKFNLDWVFIIDPYVTAMLVAGATATLVIPFWGRLAGGYCLLATGLYLAVCGFYHQQALNLACQVFRPPAVSTVAALPQPFSCRRWQLIAANKGEVQQSFVLLPYLAFLDFGPRLQEPLPPRLPVNPGGRVPNGAYRPPAEMQVQVWSGLPAPDLAGHPQAREILAEYLEFARFPLLRRLEPQGDGALLEWLDLRFSVPGRDFPFVLQVQLDAEGRVIKWLIGRGTGRGR